MATYTVTLPADATVSKTGHVADHNAIKDAIAELRTVLNGIEDRVVDLELAAE